MAQAWAARVKTTPAVIAAQIRRALRQGGSAEHAQGVQRFFKEEIKSHGWPTADLRRAAVRFRRQIQKEHGLDFLVEVADQLFLGSVREEKIAAVFLLEKLDAEFGDREYKLFESWLGRIRSWADHDALVHYCIAPMLAAKPARLKTVFRWAKSADRWHRRAVCVALIRARGRRCFFPKSSSLQNCYSLTKTIWSRRDREVRRPANCGIFDENSRPCFSLGIAHRL